MKEQLLNQIVPLLITFIIGALTAIIKVAADVFKTYLEEKKKEVITKIGQTQYEANLTMAKNIWLIVEEHFRINKIVQNVTSKKIEMFDKLLLEKIPYLRQEDIDHFRQAVAGEVNQYKEILSTTEDA
jgi:nucleoside recognition membrane protein YjiH